MERDEASSWSPPLMVTYQGKKQLIVAGAKVRSYDPATGKLIWQCAGLGLNSIPAPVSADGIVYAMTGFQNPQYAGDANRPGGRYHRY